MEESPIDNILAQATGKATSNSALDKAYDAVEGVYDSLGMMKGESAPAKRLLFTGAVAGGLAYAIKPRVSFDEKGAADKREAVPPATAGELYGREEAGSEI